MQRDNWIGGGREGGRNSLHIYIHTNTHVQTAWSEGYVKVARLDEFVETPWSSQETEGSLSCSVLFTFIV